MMICQLRKELKIQPREQRSQLKMAPMPLKFDASNDGETGTNEGTCSPAGRTVAVVPAIDALLGVRHTGIEAVRRGIGATMEATAVPLLK